jgi:hypothetical protein
MNSLIKVPPYSKLNFQGKIFFTQIWCNITLRIIDLLVVFTFYVTASVSMFYFLLDYGTVMIVWYILFHLSFLDFVFDDNILSFLFFIINISWYSVMEHIYLSLAIVVLNFT